MSKQWNAENVHSTLQSIKIASPCHVPLDKMEDRGNCFYCHDCQLNVYHFATLTNAEIASLLNQNNEKLCISMFKRDDGTVITKDCPLGMADLGIAYRKNGVHAALLVVFIILFGFRVTSWLAGPGKVNHIFSDGVMGKSMPIDRVE